MRTKLIICNETKYCQRDLRKIILAAINKFFDVNNFRFEAIVSYSRERCESCKNAGTITGLGNREVECPSCHLMKVTTEERFSNAAKQILIKLPKMETDMPNGVLANLADCLQKNRPYPHFSRGNVEVPSWATGMKVSLKQPRPLPTLEDRVEARGKRARALLSHWMRKAKLASTKIKILRRKVAYYEKRAGNKETADKDS